MGPVGIVGHQRVAALTQPPADDPVVGTDVALVLPGREPVLRRVDAALGKLKLLDRVLVLAVLLGEVLRTELDRTPECVVQPQDVRFEEGAVDGRVESDVRLSRMEVGHAFDGFRTHGSHCPPVVQLGTDVSEQPLMSGDDHIGRPGLWPDTQQFEFDRQEVRVSLRFRNVGVHTVHVGRDDDRTPVVVVIHLLGQVAAVSEEAEPDVTLDLVRPKELGNRARGLSTPHLELKEPVTSRRVSLGKEEIVLGLGIDMVDAPSVADDLDRLLEAIGSKGLGGSRVEGRCQDGQAEPCDDEADSVTE